MIFKRLFTPSHHSNDPSTRKAAIEKLSPAKPQDKAALHELAFNDSDPSVTLAALHKLDSFALWQKTAQLSRFDTVKRVARQKVENAVLGEEGAALDAQQQKDYLLESADSELIRRALTKPVATLDDQTVLTLLQKAGQNEFILSYYQHHANTSVRRTLILSAESSQLEKYARKETDADLQSLIEDEQKRHEEQKLRPQQVAQQLTLVLSKLKALIEKNDYAEIKRRLLLLEDEFSQLSADFTWLEEEDRARAHAKFADLVARVNAHLDKLRPAWEEAQQSAAAKQAKAEADEAERKAGALIADLYHGDRMSISMAQIAEANAAVEALERALKDPRIADHSSVSQHEKQKIAQKLERHQHRINIFPTQQQLAQQFFEFLERVKKFSPATDNPSALDELKNEYETFRIKLEQMPQEWVDQWKTLYKQHRLAQKAQQQSRDEELKTIRRLLSIVDNLVEEGRYKAALTRFKKAEEAFLSLDDEQSARLQRRFEATKGQISRLEGWQAYLAEPRIPELIAQAEQLAAQQTDDIPARAGAIKSLRKQWQSLVRPGEEDAQLQRFDRALETAFAPCRAYYAQQEELRQQAKNQRLALIEQAAQLDVNNTEMAVLAKQLEKLRQDWRNAGQLEKADYEALKKQWESALATTHSAVMEWHNENRHKKQLLIDQVNTLLDAENKQDAAHQAQALQQEWKTIGHAGQRFETKLWRAFKKANDTLFSDLKSHQEQNRSKAKTADKELAAEVDKISAELSSSNIADAQQKLTDISEKAAGLDGGGPLFKRSLKQAQRAIQNAQDSLAAGKQNVAYETLLEALSFWTNPTVAVADQIPETLWQTMSKKHQTAMQNTDKKAHGRDWYTTQLELITDQPSPQEFSAQRQDIQLAMMMNKLESGEASSAEQVLLDWLSCGAITPAEEKLAVRFEHIINAFFIRSVAGRKADR